MSYDLPLIAYIIGPTNVGKTTLLELCNLDPRITTVEVGKMMRAKYPPSHFKGLNNPAHTAVEAWQMYEDGVAKGDADPKCKLIVCDGQPRDAKQTAAVIAETKHQKMFVHMWAAPEVCQARALARDGANPERMALTTARLINDLPANYDVLSRLLNANMGVVSYDTGLPSYSHEGMLKMLINYAHFHRRTP